LISDGAQNTGEIGPIEAASIARALGIRVYVVGVGKSGLIEAPSFRKGDGTYAFGVRQMVVDTIGLSSVANVGGGRLYWAESAGDLQTILKDIDRLETSELKVTAVRQVTDLFFWFINAALSLLLLELLLRWGPLRVITV
jgi:Ca-activated chloride channel family protein